MDYTDKRPVIDATRLHDSINVEEYLRPLVLQLIRQKSPGWSYECENRLFISLPDCDISSDSYFTRIPDDHLTRVILGYRCPLEAKYVTRILAARGLSATAVVRAKMCLESYAIH
jgi:hypothetical protein